MMRRIKMFNVLMAVAVLLAIGVVTVFCTRIKTKEEVGRIVLASIDDVPEEYWAKLAAKRIFFGHMSVGYNIIDGIKDVLDERGEIQLNVVETYDPAAFDAPIFAHSRVGRNTDPSSKIESFTGIMDAGVGDRVDIAFFKFCYVDIMRDSDPQQILDRYFAAIEDMQRRYPESRFLHATVPIRSVPKGLEANLKQFVKRLIGKPDVLDDNKVRLRYNQLLNAAYDEEGSVFDLALIESVRPNGLRCYAAKGAERVYVMAPEYTEDGGHLNRLGGKKAAEQLLITLAEMANSL
jgi:hypothetical protein